MKYNINVLISYIVYCVEHVMGKYKQDKNNNDTKKQ